MQQVQTVRDPEIETFESSSESLDIKVQIYLH
jgi:hypothetical protein